MDALHTDLLKIVWSYTRGLPIRFVCKKWRDSCTYKKVSSCTFSTITLLKWATSKGYKVTNRGTLLIAAKYGNTEVAVKLSSPSWATDACKVAARYGHLHIVKLVMQEYLIVKLHARSIAAKAAAGGHLHILKWLKKEGVDPSSKSLKAAAKHGHVETLKWLREQGVEWTSDACWVAAEHNRLDVMKWLRAVDNPVRQAQGDVCPLGVMLVSGASRRGHPSMVKWLVEYGVDISDMTCPYAGQHGDLELLQWLIAHNAPWTPIVQGACLRRAHKAGHTHVVEWLHSQGITIPNNW